jgi:uncharacterized membrane protein YgcG
MLFFILALLLFLSFNYLGRLQRANKLRILLIGLDDPLVQQELFKHPYKFLNDLTPDCLMSLRANPYSKKNWEEITKVAGLRMAAVATGLSASEVSSLSRDELESRFSKSSDSSSSSSSSDFGGGGGFDGGGAGGDY